MILIVFWSVSNEISVIIPIFAVYGHRIWHILAVLRLFFARTLLLNGCFELIYDKHVLIIDETTKNR